MRALLMIGGTALLTLGLATGCDTVLSETNEGLGSSQYEMYAGAGPVETPVPDSADAGSADAGSGNGGGADAGAPAAQCTAETINGVVQQCCTHVGPYGPYTNCTVFSNEFHQLCQQQGITCRSVTASCQGQPFGHAFNMAQLSNGQWCLVEPNNNGVIQPCFNDPNTPAPRALCSIMGRPLNPDGTCSCTVDQNSDTPLPINTNPVTACALAPGRVGTPPSIPAFAACEQCCRDEIAYYQNLTPPPAQSVINSWFNNCYSACRNHYHPDFVQQ
jgi:hypothetical protein